ncbi:GNAT family N-acetyltransferase [Gammaproteobacteria bacterium]|nr:GNAT family N-acetyltransferase [Gammaproteobacteria bacterium]
MNESISVRDATLEDMAAIQAIYAEAVEHGTASFELEAPDVAEMTRRWRAVFDAGLPWLVLQDSPHRPVVGYAYCGPYRPRPAYRFSGECSVYLDSASRGKGGGKLLLTALVERAETAGLQQLIAIIGDSENAPSIRLHESLGFHHVGTLSDVGFKFDRWLDTVIMQRAI